MMDYASSLAILVAAGTGIASICIGLALFMMLKEEKSKKPFILNTQEKKKTIKHKFKT
jgi:hypothetical protein